jgi:hypothetical protein
MDESGPFSYKDRISRVKVIQEEEGEMPARGEKAKTLGDAMLYLATAF